MCVLITVPLLTCCVWNRLPQVQHTAGARNHGVGWRHGHPTPVSVTAAKDAGAPAPASLTTATLQHGVGVHAMQQEHHAAHHGGAPAAQLAAGAAAWQQAPAPPPPPQQQQQQQQQGPLPTTAAAGSSTPPGPPPTPAASSAAQRAMALAAAYSQAHLGGYLPLLAAVQQAGSLADLQQVLAEQGTWMEGAHVGLAWAKLQQLVPATTLEAQLSQQRQQQQQQQGRRQQQQQGRRQQQQGRRASSVQHEQQDGGQLHKQQPAKQTTAQVGVGASQAADVSARSARALYRLVWKLLRLTQQQLPGLPPEGLAALLDYLRHLAALGVARHALQQLERPLAERLQQVAAQRGFTPGQLVRCAHGVAALGPSWAPGAVVLARLTEAAMATKAGRGVTQQEALALLAALVQWQAAVRVVELQGYSNITLQQQQDQEQQQSDGGLRDAGAHLQESLGAAEPPVASALAPAIGAQVATSGCALGHGPTAVPAKSMAALVRAALPTLQTPPVRAVKRKAGKPRGNPSNGASSSSSSAQQAAGCVVVVLHACATLGYRPSPTTLEAALVMVSQGWVHLSCHQMLAVLLSLDALGVQPWQEWLADCYTHLPGRLLGEQRLPRAVLLQLLVVLAEWEVPPPEQLLTAWCRAVVLQLPGMQLSQLQQVDALLASLWYQPPPFWQAAHRQAMAAAAAAAAAAATAQAASDQPDYSQHSSRNRRSRSRPRRQSSSRSSQPESGTNSIEDSSSSSSSRPGTGARAVDNGADSTQRAASAPGLQQTQQEGLQRVRQQQQRQPPEEQLPGVALAPERLEAPTQVAVSNGHPIAQAPPAVAAAADAAACRT